MKYKLLGHSGLRVSELCLGAMTFGQEWGFMGASKEESKKVFDAFVAVGGNFIDTANKYHEGTSEKFVGEFVKGQRERFVIATKYTLSMNANDPNAGGNHRKNLVQSVEASLKRLQTDYLDLLWVHAWDFTTPVEEMLRALDDIVRAGKVLYVGISDAPAWIVSQANTLAQLRGWSPFIGLQISYSLIERTVERDLLPMAKDFDIGVTAWSPLGGGVLTGKYNAKESNEPRRYSPDNPWSARMVNERNLAVAAAVVTLAKEIKRTPSQVALNWVRQQTERGVIIPILGARTAAQITDNLGCLDFELTGDQLARLNEISQIELGFPHDFIKRGEPNPFLYGTGEIVNHRDR